MVPVSYANDYYQQLLANAQIGMSPVQQGLGQYDPNQWDRPFQTPGASSYDPQGGGYRPGAMGNQGFFIPGGMGGMGGYGQQYQPYQQGSPVNQALQQYYQQPGMQMGPGGQPVQQMMAGGAGTPNLANQLALMQAQFGLQQQGEGARMGRAQSAAGQLGLDPSTASSMAEQMASVKDLTTQRESEGAMQAIRNQLARGGMGISSEGDKLMADVLGTTAAQTRSNRTMAEIQMRQWMTQMLSQILGRGI